MPPRWCGARLRFRGMRSTRVARSDRLRSVRGVTSCHGSADDYSMPIDAQTQAIPRVPTPVVAVRDPEAAASQPEAEVARTESVQHMYEDGLAKLEALHDRWTAAVAEIREAQSTSEPEDAAA